MATINWMNTSRADVTTDITFADNTHTTSSGIKIQDLAYKNQKLVIQTPKTMTPFGISLQYKSEDKFEITLQLEENNALHEQFQRMLKAIEASVVEYIFNHQEILGITGKSFEIIADKLSSCIKQSEKYGKSIGPKVETKDGVFKALIFDSSQIEVTEVAKKSFNYVLIEIPYVWVTSGRFGLRLKCIQVQTFPCEEKKISSLEIVNMED
jgi:hypothetical protein